MEHPRSFLERAHNDESPDGKRFQQFDSRVNLVCQYCAEGDLVYSEEEICYYVAVSGLVF